MFLLHGNKESIAYASRLVFFFFLMSGYTLGFWLSVASRGLVLVRKVRFGILQVGGFRFLLHDDYQSVVFRDAVQAEAPRSTRCHVGASENKGYLLLGSLQ